MQRLTTRLGVGFSRARCKTSAGAFGENLTIDGLVEDDLRVGDVHIIGSARLRSANPASPVSNSPCGSRSRMPHAMVMNRRSGWYYRVLEPESSPRGRYSIGGATDGFPFARLVAIASAAGRQRTNWSAWQRWTDSPGI